MNRATFTPQSRKRLPVIVGVMAARRIDQTSSSSTWEATMPAPSHRKTGTPEYRIWSGMHTRCSNPNRDFAHRYMERGIRVCPEWTGPGGFEAFYAHVGPRPSPRHSIDRIDNDRGYEPGNVRWATPAEQQRNQERTAWLTHNGETLPIKEWADRHGISYYALYHRVQNGWPVDRALSQPVHDGSRLSERESSQRKRARRLARMAVDPEYAALVESRKRARADRLRERMASDPEYAAEFRAHHAAYERARRERLKGGSQ